jgi:hypothetical protein
MPDEITFFESNLGYDAVLACRLVDRGFMRLSETNWICFVANSGHVNPSVGDIILAIDQSGNVFYINTHVCGNLSLFVGVDMKKPLNSDDFFARFPGETKGSEWIKLNIADGKTAVP